MSLRSAALYFYSCFSTQTGGFTVFADPLLQQIELAGLAFCALGIGHSLYPLSPVFGILRSQLAAGVYTGVWVVSLMLVDSSEMEKIRCSSTMLF